MTNWNKIRRQLGNRSAIIAAGVAGFVIGAGGFVAAQVGDAPAADVRSDVEMEASVEVESESTVDDSVPESSVSPTSIDLTVPVVTIDDSTSSSVPDTIDDSTSSSVPNTTIDDSTSSSVPNTTIDDSTSSSVPDTIDDSTSSSVPVALPAAFVRSFQSFGGSIEVSWTGTAFVLESVSPAPGFRAEIEDQSWDRIRVDFEGDDDDARIEVRMDAGQIRVRID